MYTHATGQYNMLWQFNTSVGVYIQSRMHDSNSLGAGSGSVPSNLPGGRASITFVSHVGKGIHVTAKLVSMKGQIKDGQQRKCITIKPLLQRTTSEPLKSSLHQGVHYIRVFTTSGCSLYQSVHYIRVFTTSGCSLHQGVHHIWVFTTSGCSLHQGAHYIRGSLHQGAHYIRGSLHQGVHYIRVLTTSGCSLPSGCSPHMGVHNIDQGSFTIESK